MADTETEITFAQLIVDRISYLDRSFEIVNMFDAVGYLVGWTLHVLYTEPDVDNPATAKLQRTRGWFIPRGATETDIVNTALAALLRSAEHQVREHFYYQPIYADAKLRVASPHFEIDDMLRVALHSGFIRKDP